LGHSGIVLTTGGRRRCTGGVRSSVGCNCGSSGGSDGSSRNFIVGGHIVNSLFIIIVPEKRTPKVVITIHKV
jgi:hypothetical protein